MVSLAKLWPWLDGWVPRTHRVDGRQALRTEDSWPRLAVWKANQEPGKPTDAGWSIDLPIRQWICNRLSSFSILWMCLFNRHIVWAGIKIKVMAVQSPKLWGENHQLQLGEKLYKQQCQDSKWPEKVTPLVGVTDRPRGKGGVKSLDQVLGVQVQLLSEVSFNSPKKSAANIWTILNIPTIRVSSPLECY